MRGNTAKIVAGLLFICLALQACGAPSAQPTATQQPAQATQAPVASPTTQAAATATEAPTVAPTAAAIQHLTKPDQPIYFQYQLTNDCVVGETYKNTGTILPSKTCDNWLVNFIERPFSPDLKSYYPFEDIGQTQFGANKDWYFGRIHPYDPTLQAGDPVMTYGFVLDLNFDGLADLFIAVTDLPMSGLVWTVKGVRAWQFVDGQVNLIFDSGSGTDPDLIWVRRVGQNIEIAFKPSILNGDNTFAWSAWALSGDVDPTQILPITTLSSDRYGIDNTCARGFNLDIKTTNLANKCTN
ncbi:MAG TPA: hypothetical protein VMC09_07425 [Anaerolineales bacterium]|nr:hypothetical protein [Anaerolineales bacterium]